VSNDNDMTPQMEQLLRSMNQEVPKTKRILELNPSHPLIEKLQTAFGNQAVDSSKLEDYSYLLYNQALLAEGSPLPEPGKFSKLLSSLLVGII